MSAYLQWTFAGVAGTFAFDAVTSETHELGALVTEHPVEDGVNVVDHVRPNPARITLSGLVTQTPIFGDNIIRSIEVRDIAAPPQDYAADSYGTIVYPAALPPNPLQYLQLAELGVIAGQTALSGGGAGSRVEGLAAVGVLAAGILAGADGPFPLQQAADYGRTQGPTQFSSPVDTPVGSTNYISAAIQRLQFLQNTATLCTVMGGGGGDPTGGSGVHYENCVVENIEVSRESGAGGSASISVTLREIRIVSSAFVAAPKPTIPRAAPAVNKGSQAGTASPPPQQKTALRALAVGAG